MIGTCYLGYPGENLSIGARLNRTVMLNERHPEEILPQCIELASQNLHDLLTILQWNEKNGIKFFRISSALFPHISNWRLFEDRLNYQTLAYSLELFEEQIKKIGSYANEHQHRLTFHPLPYTVLNTPKHFTYISVLRDLWWHTEFFRIAGLGLSSTITIHLGGIYGDKVGAKKNIH